MKIQILNLNPSFDHTGIVKHETESNVVRVDEVVALSSGKGIDVARVLHILGYKDYIVSNIIGGKVGRLIKAGLEEEGLKSWNFAIKDESRINYAYVDEFKGDILMINEQGPVIINQEKEEYFAKLECWLEKDQILVLSGSAVRGFSENDIRKIIKLARKKNMYIVVDISKHFLTACLKESIDFLKINNEEFISEYEKDYAYQFTKKDDFIKVIESEGLKKTIITFGKDGALFYNNGKILYGKNKKIFSDYAVGSGDSFLAGYLYAYVNNYNLSNSLKFAMACGAANTRSYGAGLMKYEHIEEIRDNYLEIINLN
ncbi:PfkB family carbohydrate kinase [Halocella sp. SP3-1]|uniref:1-phosphofructokinase family hexose kinase n=1 Tax=Halocella sp. SP3-1 TaxID=2382161 RepID=UPI000F75CDC9|nr:PfkB family carbohydrate kinase [Halocella sp. SP3-1]AZO94281.1 ribokinase [Halocella sp. SP3-1]MTI58712.1 ribokinase [Bacillota bacterium]